MNRRGMLGLIAGGVAAGPGMVKTAAAQTMADLNFGALGLATGGDGAMIAGMPAGSNDWAQRGLAELLGRTALEHAKAKRELHIGGLDPDVASLHSVSLTAKVRIQRERSYLQHLENQQSYFERCIANVFT